MNNLNRTTSAYAIAAILAISANTLLMIAKEEYAPLKASMKAALGHHWTTHAVVIVLAFLILGLALSKWRSLPRLGGALLTLLLVAATVAGSSGIVGFFLLE